MKTAKILSALLVIPVAFFLNSFTLKLEGYKAGDKAIDFKLKNIDGKMMSMSDCKNAKGYIVVFTCNHCPFSKLYEDRIIALDKKYDTKGYPVVAINSNDPGVSPDDSYEKMIVRAKDKKFTFPYLYDETQTIAKTYGATNTPHVYVVAKENGALTVKYVGAIDDNSEDATKATKHYVEDAVDALLAGKAVPVAQTKAIGCTIKWKKSS
jgi:peroxiredoxin